MRSLTLAKRRELLRLTARSGSLANLQLLLPLVGCTPEYRRQNPEVLVNAAKAGHLHVCQWLRQQGSPWDEQSLEAAGESGSWQVCEWAMAGGCPGGASAAMRGAARAGHVGLLDRLLAAHGPPGEREVKCVLAAVAEGCDLASLQRLYETWSCGSSDGEKVRVAVLTGLSRFASSSPTPDWRAKVEWLGAVGCPREQPLCPARCPDAVERLEWLEARGWATDREEALYTAAERGDLECLEFLSPMQREGQPLATSILVYGGHLRALQALHTKGWDLDPSIATSAARGGHLHVVVWAMETLGEQVITDEVFEGAASSGNMELLVWLRDHGCPYRDMWEHAVESGCEEVMEWLDANDFPLSEQFDYTHRVVIRKAACAGDLATLACLRRLGCAWTEETFTEAVGEGGVLPALRWLVEQGCPVDWGAALSAARWQGAETCGWLKEQAAARG